MSVPLAAACALLGLTLGLQDHPTLPSPPAAPPTFDASALLSDCAGIAADYRQLQEIEDHLRSLRAK